MLYRKFGGTDLDISEIGFGCGNTAGLMIWGSEADRVRAAAHAMELGVNYFDTAATYGDGKSEENLGPVLAQLPERPLVGSKVALQEEELADIPGNIRKSVERSLRRLGLERLDIVHLHNRVTARREPGKTLAIGALLNVEQMLGEGGVQETFEALRREGKVRHFGYCAFGGDPAAYREVAEKGAFESILVFYNILNPTSDRTMPAGFGQHDYGQIMGTAAERGVGTVILRVLEAGALSGSATPHEMNRGGPGNDAEYARKRGACASAGVSEARRGRDARPGRRALRADEPRRLDRAGGLLGDGADRRGSRLRRARGLFGGAVGAAGAAVRDRLRAGGVLTGAAAARSAQCFSSTTKRCGGR